MGIQITKKMLQDYDKLKKEIPLLKAEISEMQHTDAGIGSSTILDYREGFPRPQAVIGFDREKFERRKRSLEKKEKQVAAVENWIECIEDDRTRLVFEMFYIKRYSWAKIKNQIKYYGTADSIRIRIRDDYLKKCGIK